MLINIGGRKDWNRNQYTPKEEGRAGNTCKRYEDSTVVNN